MIIACPACATRYVVPDSAIGIEGRTVRCAKCKHSWYQDGPELAEPITAAYAAPVGAEGEIAAATPPPRPSAEPRAVGATPTAGEAPAMPSSARAPDPQIEETVDGGGKGANAPSDLPNLDERPLVDWAAELQADPDESAEEVSHFDHRPPFRPRRNWLRWMSWGAGVFAVLAIAAVAAMSTLGVPSWLPIEQPLFGADPGLTVEFPASEQERRTLPNGAEFFGARVVVKNETRETRAVPPLLIVLRDARERVVYSWELAPPQRSLAPGEAMTINEAMTDVPKSAVYADIGWAPR